MARKAQVNFYPDRGGYFCRLLGRWEPLCYCEADDRPAGPHYQKAVKALSQLLSRRHPEPGEVDTVAQVMEEWLAHIALMRPRSLKVYTTAVAGFADWCEGAHPLKITAEHIEGWLIARTSWDDSSKGTAFARIKSAFAYAAGTNRLPADPLKRAKCPPRWRERARGAEYVLDDDLVELLIRLSKPHFADLLTVLSETGARPGELINAEHWHYRPGKEPHIFFSGDATKGYVWKNARRKIKGDRNRRIYLPPRSLEIVQRNATRRTWLFPAQKGGRIQESTLIKNLKILQRRPEVVKWLDEHGASAAVIIPYAFRHTFITAAIKRGVRIKTLADLCGTSVQQIEDHYSHATADLAHMHAEALRCLG